MLFSLFRFFGKARQECYISKSSKIENVNISLDREHFHLPKTPKRESPETRFWRKQLRCSERLQNGIVKIRPGFPSKSPHGFAKNGLARVSENAPARTRPTRRPEVPQIENVTISLYREHFHLPKKLKGTSQGGSSEGFRLLLSVLANIDCFSKMLLWLRFGACFCFIKRGPEFGALLGNPFWGRF